MSYDPLMDRNRRFFMREQMRYDPIEAPPPNLGDRAVWVVAVLLLAALAVGLL